MGHSIEIAYNDLNAVAYISLHGITEIAHRETIRGVFERFKKSSGWGALYHPIDGKPVLTLSIYLNLKGITFISRAALDEILCQNDRLGGHVINLRNLNRDITPMWFVVKRTRQKQASNIPEA